MNLIYLGRHFYNESGSIMSSLYDVDGNRQDWGFVERALVDGKSVHIRPATKAELQHYTQLLEKLKEKA